MCVKVEFRFIVPTVRLMQVHRMCSQVGGARFSLAFICIIYVHLFRCFTQCHALCSEAVKEGQSEHYLGNEINLLYLFLSLLY